MFRAEHALLMLADIERARCEDSLLEFFKRAWREVDPAPLKVSWHHVGICEHLEAVVRGEIRRLIINVPPRHTKSHLVSVMLPAWCWLQEERGPMSGPQVKFLCVSYGQTLSEDLARLARRLVLSDWYQGHWGKRVQLDSAVARVDNFGTLAGGARIASSVTGSTLGRGGDCRILDDVLSVDQAESKVERETANKMYSEALQTRETDPETSCEIIIMQRLHEEDLTGYILSKSPDDVVQVVYPARHDPARHSVTSWYEDPRTAPGELLWPERFTEAELRRLELALGPYAFAGQYQQQPTPRGGGIFKREWVEAWPPMGPEGEILPGWIERRGAERRIRYPSFEYIVAWVDSAFTSKEQNDPCAMTVWGVFRQEGTGRIDRRPDGSYVRIEEGGGYPKVMLIAGWSKHLDVRGPSEQIPDGVSRQEWAGAAWREARTQNWGLVEWVVDTCKRWKVDYLGIETQGQGYGLQNELRLQHAAEVLCTVELVPARQDKVARAHSVVHVFSGRQVYFPQYEDGTYPLWLTPLADELFIFPRGRHDDVVDTASGALRHLRERGLLEREEEYEEAERSMASYERHRPASLPYGL